MEFSKKSEWGEERRLRIRVLGEERVGERVEREKGIRLHRSKSMYVDEHAIEIVCVCVSVIVCVYIGEIVIEGERRESAERERERG